MNKNKLNTGMYIIDKEYRILNVNKSMNVIYPEVKVGDLCYKSLAKADAPCSSCPLLNNDVLFFNPVRKEWISANAAEIDYPGHGECYTIQFKMRKSIGGTKREIIQLERIDEYVAQLQSADEKKCIIGAYCEPASPIFFANEEMVSLLGYSSLDEMIDVIDGMTINLVHPDDREKVEQEILQVKSEGDTFKTTHRTQKKDGSWLWVVVSGKAIVTASGKLATLGVCKEMSTFLNDHMAMKKEKEELAQKEELNESLLSNIPGCYHRCSTDEECSFLHISESFEETVGWTKEEIAEQFDNKFINLVYPEDLSLFDDLIAQIEDKGQGSIIYHLKKKGGGYIWVQDSTMLIETGKENFYQCTLADITPYVNEMEKAKALAEANSHAKSTFLFNISHDIRTPMNAIMGYANIIEENKEDVQMVGKTIQKIQQASNTLMTLMNDVLDLSRIERGKEELNLEPVRMHEHGQGLIEMFASEMKAAGINFIVDSDITHNHVMCDTLKLTRVGMNMLSNAQKFTPKGGTVTFGIHEIACDEDTATYYLYTRDTGVGMSKEFLNRAFEQFERERTSTESRVNGSGLGLAIIKKFVELMGGTVGLKSELGKGTEISATLTFPLVKGVQSQAYQPKKQSIDLTGKRILVVEDNEFNREIAKYVLEGMNLVVEEAENGAVCIEKLMSAEPEYFDLILMDIQMPVMDGYIATMEIRNFTDKQKANIPIVAMSANAFDEDKRKCLEIGMNGHIGKPIDANVLSQMLTVLLV